MKIDIDQNTPEWLEFRKSKIGASDAPIIMGVSPWKTPLQLWEEKIGAKNDSVSNYATERGKRLEPVALAAYNELTGNDSTPQVWSHESSEWMIASLDGLSSDGSVAVEIKCAGREDHELAKSGKVPEKYYPQLQHQLFVLGHEKIHYFSYTEDDFCLLEIERDDKYITSLCKKEKNFFEKLRNFEEPALTDRDYVQRNDEEWNENAIGLKEVREQLEALQEKEKAYRENLIRLAGGRSSQGSGVKVQKVIRKGTVSYGKIPELIGVDLEPYRGKSIETWRIQ